MAAWPQLAPENSASSLRALSAALPPRQEPVVQAHGEPAEGWPRQQPRGPSPGPELGVHRSAGQPQRWCLEVAFCALPSPDEKGDVLGGG